MNVQPLVTIVIPVYNGSNYLKEAIESALNQTYKRCEVIIVNDGSCDNGATEKIALSYGDKVRYLKKQNGGVSSALNEGIKYMKGDYLSWLSHDDVYYPQKIEKEIKALNTVTDKTTIVLCEYEYYNEQTKSYSCVDFKNSYSLEQLSDSVFSVLRLTLHACCALIHKQNFERVGLFDENLRYVQDLDMLFRLLKNKNPIWVQETLYKVRVHSESDGACFRDEANMEYRKVLCHFFELLTDDELQRIYGTKENAFRKILSKLKSIDGWDEAIWLQNKVKTYQLSNQAKNIKEALQKYILSITERKNIQIVLFGIGKIGKALCCELMDMDIDIYCFGDNDQQKVGQVYRGVVCRSVKELEKDKYDILVVVSLRVYDDVVKQLKSMGFPYVITFAEIDKILNQVAY